MKLLLACVMIVAIIGLWRYNEHVGAQSEQAALAAQNRKPFQPVGSGPLGRAHASHQTAAFQAPQPETVVSLPARFNCDGRTHCSHMRSCEEAEYFLQHCPNTSMDGDNDGIPCEKQWC